MEIIARVPTGCGLFGGPLRERKPSPYAKRLKPSKSPPPSRPPVQSAKSPVDYSRFKPLPFHLYGLACPFRAVCQNLPEGTALPIGIHSRAFHCQYDIGVPIVIEHEDRRVICPSNWVALAARDDGLYFYAGVPDTVIGEWAIETARAGGFTGVSIAFTSLASDIKEVRGERVRRILCATLLHIGLIGGLKPSNPAFTETFVEAIPA